MPAYTTTLVAGAEYGDTTATLENGLDKLALEDYKWECDEPESEAKSLMQWYARDAHNYEIMDTVGYKTDDGYVEAPNHNIVVNETLGHALPGTVSDQFRPIPNQLIVTELANALKNMEMGEHMTALARQHPSGTFMDMYFNHDCAHYEIEGVADTISSGLTAKWDHGGNSTVRVSPFIRFGNCRNTMRELTDENGEKIEFKLHHRGELNEEEVREDLFEGITEMLFRLGTLKSDVIDPIKESRDMSIETDEFDFSGVETDAHVLTDLYRGLGLPQRDAEAATVRAAYRANYLGRVTPAQGSNADERQGLLDRLPENLSLSALDIVNGYTWTLKYVSTADLNGSTYNTRQRTAYDLLGDPAEKLAAAYTTRVGELESTDDSDEMDAEKTAARIETLAD